jgi:hypothetical protein
MSVSFSYRTVHSVDAKTKAEILESAKRTNQEREWWCEPLAFFDHPEYPDSLAGDTKLFLLGFSRSGR